MGVCFSNSDKEKENAKIVPDNKINYKNPKILKINGMTVKNNNLNYISSINPVRKKWTPKSKIEKIYPLKYKDTKYKNKLIKKREDTYILVPGYIESITDSKD